jgi:hypothetical protein
MKKIIILLLITIIALFYFLNKGTTKPKFIYSLPSLIISTTETNSLKIGDITLVTFRDKPTLIDMVIESVNDKPFNPRQRVVKKYEGTNEVPLYDPEDYPTNRIVNTNSLLQSPASLPTGIINPYFPNPIPTPKPVSPGGFR